MSTKLTKIALGSFSDVELDTSHTAVNLKIPYMRKWLSLFRYIYTIDYIGEMESTFDIAVEDIENEHGYIQFDNGSSLILDNRAVSAEGEVPSMFILDVNFMEDAVRSGYILDDKMQQVDECQPDILKVMSAVNKVMGGDCALSNGTDIITMETEPNRKHLIEYLIITFKECDVFRQLRGKIKDLTGILTIRNFNSVPEDLQEILLKTLANTFGITQCLVLEESLNTYELTYYDI